MIIGLWLETLVKVIIILRRSRVGKGGRDETRTLVSKQDPVLDFRHGGDRATANRSAAQSDGEPILNVTTPGPPISLAELEKLIGGRTTLTLKLQDATLEEVAKAMSGSSGLDV
ncbi:MAG: hypothetical protein JWN98_2162 [Abditibacteriota bacterium]|nr:hypothetical protein [Abditibacteriota bacterium]